MVVGQATPPLLTISDPLYKLVSHNMGNLVRVRLNF